MKAQKTDGYCRYCGNETYFYTAYDGCICCDTCFLEKTKKLNLGEALKRAKEERLRDNKKLTWGQMLEIL